MSPEGLRADGDEVDSSNGSGIQIANEVLAISLGISNDCPGMLPEQKVRITIHSSNKLCYCFVSVEADCKLYVLTSVVMMLTRSGYDMWSLARHTASQKRLTVFCTYL